MSGAVPAVRIRAENDAAVRPDGEYVLYFMIAARRTRYSFALDRALERCRELGMPLVVLEPLRAGYRHASDRLHRFVLQGMAENQRRLRKAGVLYHPYVEPTPGAGKGLFAALAARAGVVVTDYWPSFFVPRLVRAAARACPVRLESVDGNGVLPLFATERVFKTAHAFRRVLHEKLAPHLEQFPRANPLARADLPILERLPREVAGRWPRAGPDVLAAGPAALSSLPIDHGVGPGGLDGGAAEAERRLKRFVAERLSRYADDRNLPEEEGTSGLSAYLHFGHISSHEIVRRVLSAEDWSAGGLNPKAGGKRVGYWGVGESAEAFLDQVVTWREVGFHTSAKMEGYDRYESLPGWARESLEAHEADPREHLYALAQLEAARTHDHLWNAAQTQLVREGRIHNYLRMLWGKKILKWSPTPREALARMLHLNDRYALDGRDPNSVSGIFWCLGRYDRAWGPERPIFGKVRYMTSANTARKFPLKGYLAKYRPE